MESVHRVQAMKYTGIIGFGDPVMPYNIASGANLGSPGIKVL